MIKLENITKVFYTDEIQTKALDSVNLEVGRQEFVSIMGPSGCGKSTLLNIIGLLDEPSGGSSFQNRRRGYVQIAIRMVRMPFDN